jgi:hypothetical protein
MDTQIALAVTKIANDRPYRVVDLPNVLTQERRRADPLYVSTRVRRTQARGIARVRWAGPVN